MRWLKHWLLNPEVLGPPNCPLFRRWTIYGADGLIPRLPGFKGKLVVHHFFPNTEDADPHDHPWWFWTLVLKGGYLDLIPCQRCGGERFIGRNADGSPGRCTLCWSRGVIEGEQMKRGRFRRRAAGHCHVTKISSAGAWTLCLMGPKEQVWGFWRQRKRWQWQQYEAEFGLAFRCDTDGNRVVEVTRPEGTAPRPAVLTNRQRRESRGAALNERLEGSR